MFIAVSAKRLEKDEFEDTLGLKTTPSDHFRTDCSGSEQVCPTIWQFLKPCLVMSAMQLITLSVMRKFSLRREAVMSMLNQAYKLLMRRRGE